MELERLVQATEGTSLRESKIIGLLRNVGDLPTLSDGKTCITKGVAAFFDVTENTIWTRLRSNRTPIEAAGYRVQGRQQLAKKFPELLADSYRGTTQLGVWPPLAVLLLGIKLPYSPVAERIRAIVADLGESGLDAEYTDRVDSQPVVEDPANHPTEREEPSSPFDAIRRLRLDGTEYWRARDLMPLLGYQEWRKFAGAIERATQTAINQGYPLDEHFMQIKGVIGGGDKNLGGRPSVDYELSRFGCYLVAMNGDPRKPEVAAAQAYFAIRTRQAEEAEESAPMKAATIQTATASTALPDNPIDLGIARARARMEVVALARGVIADSHLEAEARIILAEARGVRPQIEEDGLPLYVSDYLESKGMTSTEAEKNAPTFGKKLKARYLAVNGKIPQTSPRRLTDGSIRNICAYTHSDIDLFDEVWMAYE